MYSSFTHSIDIWEKPEATLKHFVVVKPPLSGCKYGDSQLRPPEDTVRLRSVLLELKILYHEPTRTHLSVIKLHYFMWD